MYPQPNTANPTQNARRAFRPYATASTAKKRDANDAADTTASQSCEGLASAAQATATMATNPNNVSRLKRNLCMTASVVESRRPIERRPTTTSLTWAASIVPDGPGATARAGASRHAVAKPVRGVN
jgi:hypothetical protein